MRPLVPLLLAIFGASCAHAEIIWKQKVVELRADAASTVLEARFPFSNAGTAPIEITQVESSCGCTTANLEKRRYEPRESGEIVARYTVGTQRGLQEKTILVTTNDGRAPTALTLEIHLPEFVRLLPSSVRWAHGEASTPKTITLEILQEAPAKAVSVTSTALGFDTQVVARTPGRRYELSVRPPGTDQPRFTTLQIRCQFGDQEKVFSAYAGVNAAEAKD